MTLQAEIDIQIYFDSVIDRPSNHTRRGRRSRSDRHGAGFLQQRTHNPSAMGQNDVRRERGQFGNAAVVESYIKARDVAKQSK